MLRSSPPTSIRKLTLVLENADGLAANAKRAAFVAIINLHLLFLCAGQTGANAECQMGKGRFLLGGFTEFSSLELLALFK